MFQQTAIPLGSLCVASELHGSTLPPRTTVPALKKSTPARTRNYHSCYSAGHLAGRAAFPTDGWSASLDIVCTTCYHALPSICFYKKADRSLPWCPFPGGISPLSDRNILILNLTVNQERFYTPHPVRYHL